MLLNTRARRAGDVWTVRVVGDDVAEVAGAAKLIGAPINVTKGGRHWFRATLEQLPIVRDAYIVCACDLAGWVWWARPKEESRADTTGGAFSVDLPDESDRVQPDAGVNPNG